MIDLQSFYETSKPIVFAFALKVLGAIAIVLGVVLALLTPLLRRLMTPVR